MRAIVEDDVYRRSTRRTLLDRFGDWVAQQIRELLDLIPPITFGREILLGIAALLVIVLVARLVMRWTEDKQLVAGAGTARGRGGRLDPWLEAERLAASGDHLAAAQALCAALLGACARRGEVVLHQSKTTGDYAREMRRRNAPSLPAFQRFRSRYDRVIYDAQACDAAEYAALVSAATPLLHMERAA
ncbi:MAG: DUF4129 domain-containing protein [Gemmatimonadaceae bacterium]|nr:DUF4129 domain-containing protein [Gemmatimonadaceae bacterium]